MINQNIYINYLWKSISHMLFYSRHFSVNRVYERVFCITQSLFLHILLSACLAFKALRKSFTKALMEKSGCKSFTLEHIIILQLMVSFMQGNQRLEKMRFYSSVAGSMGDARCFGNVGGLRIKVSGQLVNFRMNFNVPMSVQYYELTFLRCCVRFLLLVRKADIKLTMIGFFL